MHTVAISSRKTRNNNDFYPTPAQLTHKLLEVVDIDPGVTILEPCAGEGDILNVLQYYNVGVVASDISWQPHPGQTTTDATERLFWHYWKNRLRFEWVITNPPFNEASAILPLAYKHASVGVCFLLRLSYLEPTKARGDWFLEHMDNMSNLIIFGQPRPSFTGDRRVDSVTTAWMVWRKDWSWKAKGCHCPFEFVFNWRDSYAADVLEAG
ncbi:hypothetical protein PCC6912_50720 [Chlorogloeopsis fritschii PCC 6912]|uniref:SAM-dependent methyltransferase n=1 Tax=Chlorogloeopsis fritschii PCC 6912 TaxID=211165 RepID=A0A433N1N0_CHLFR|nr:hypothetical protein [Chlorogloeopsis fritschii]RUR74894.1 hypothetical protein PCC6912_50720 [Chlorogloeopsis fritschii PCC 6912]